MLIVLGMVFFFCSTGKRPGKSRNLKNTQAPGWAKRIWNAEGTIGAKHGHGEKVKTKGDVESAVEAIDENSVVQQHQYQYPSQDEYEAQQQQQQYEYHMQIQQQQQQQQSQQYYPPPESTDHQQDQWYGGQTQAYFPPPQAPGGSPTPPAAYGTAVYYAPPGEAAKQDTQISVAER
jgi:hypothetical protein